MNFFKNNTTKIVPKSTTFSYSKKTPKDIIEERELKKTNLLFNEVNKDKKINSFNNLNNFKGKFK